MCSKTECICEAIGDRPIVKSIEESSLVSQTEQVCKKCRSEDIQVRLKVGDGGYCKNCFLTRTSHKFRATLGKSKLIRKDDAVLVLHDGTASSTALLHLIKLAQNESAAKRLLIRPTILYIDENVLEKRSMQQRHSCIKSIVEPIQKLEFTAFTTSLTSLSTDSISLDAINDTYQPALLDPDETLSRALSSLTDHSAKEELVTLLRRRLLLTAARHLRCSKILMPDTSMDIAVRLLSDLALGRGAQLSFDVDFIDARYSDVMFLRPMKDFTAEEIVHYLSYCNVPSTSEFHSAVKESNIAMNNTTTLQTMTRSFVAKLDDEFSGTVPTIFRTGGKLSSEVAKCRETNDFCMLCNATLDSDPTVLSSDDKLFAIRAKDFSKLVSSTLKMDCTDDEKLEYAENRSVPDATENSSRTCQQRLCYGCKLIWNNFDGGSDVSSLLAHFEQGDRQ